MTPKCVLQLKHLSGFETINTHVERNTKLPMQIKGHCFPILDYSSGRVNAVSLKISSCKWGISCFGVYAKKKQPINHQYSIVLPLESIVKKYYGQSARHEPTFI